MDKLQNTEKSAILIIDDNRCMLLAMRSELNCAYHVVIAQNSREAVKAMMNNSFEAALIDVSLGEENGFDLGNELKDADPDMAVIIMTCSAGNYRESFPGFDDYIVKSCTETNLISVIKNAVYRKTMSSKTRLRRMELLHKVYPCKGTVLEVFRRVIREKNGQVEKLVGKFYDGVYASWNAYQLFEHKNFFTTSVATTVGCLGRCHFCIHGNEPVSRLLSWQEIISQALHGLDSLLAMGVFEENKPLQPCLHFTGTGEPLSNWSNVQKAILLLADIKELDYKFIITTIGRETDLKEMLDSLEFMKMDLSKISLYLSVNFSDPDMRVEMMPATKLQNFASIRKSLTRFKEMTGNDPTASFIVFPGLNDTEEDVERIFADWGEFRIKLQAFAPSPGFSNFPVANLHQLQTFRRRLIKAGVEDVRTRTVIGGSENAGCGSTSPDMELMQ